MSAWDTQIDSWGKLRDQADFVIKKTLEKNFPCSYATADPDDEKSPRKYAKAGRAMGRALWVYARSDLTMKTMQLKKADAKRK